MDGSMFIGTWWSLVPPLLAIVLALVTKEVYSSLFIGVAMGALLYTGFHPWNAFVAFFDIMKNSMNLNILIFDVLLGMIIVLMSKSGGSAANDSCNNTGKTAAMNTAYTCTDFFQEKLCQRKGSCDLLLMEIFHGVAVLQKFPGRSS